MVASDAGYLSI